MDLFRRLHQNSYPPRPSPLSSSQEPRDDRARQPSGLSPAHDIRRRADGDKARPASRYEYPPTSSHLYSPGVSRESQGVRGENAGAAISPPRNQHAHQHRRNASLETRQHAHAHRRNHSQPQGAHYREGLYSPKLFFSSSFLFWGWQYPSCSSKVSLLWPPDSARVGVGLVPWFSSPVRFLAPLWARSCTRAHTRSFRTREALLAITSTLAPSTPLSAQLYSSCLFPASPLLP